MVSAASSGKPVSGAVARLFLGVLAFKVILLFIVMPKISGLSGSAYAMDRFSDGYDMLASSLAQGYGYRFYPDTSLTLMREPGYPLFMAALFWVFGYGLTVVKLANLLLSCIGAYLVMLLSRRVGRGRYRYAEVIAPCLFLLHPGLIIAESRGGYEVMFVMFLLLFLWFLYRALDSGHVHLYIVSGLVLGAAMLVKSTVMFLPVFFLAYLLIFERARVRPLAALRNIALMGVAMALVMSPWVIRNYEVSGKFVPTASVFGVAAFTGSHICKNLAWDKRMQAIDTEAAHILTDRAKAEGYHFKGDYYRYFYSVDEELDFNSRIWKEVRDEYINSPLLFVNCATQNVFKFWFAGKSWTATGLNVILQLPYIALAVAGAVMAYRKGDGRDVGPLVLIILYYMAVHVAVHAQARYSVPVIPLVSILAALPLAALLRRKYI